MKTKDQSNKKIVGLIGHPVSHSLSPAMHNAAFAHLGLNFEYTAWDIAPGEFDRRVEEIRAIPGWVGANVTIPHKVAAKEYADSLTPEAELIGAVNTLVLQPDGSVLGDNTDGRGFVRALREDLALDPAGKRVLLLGAGGAALAVAVSVCREKASRLFITDLDHGKRDELVGLLHKKFPDVLVASLENDPSAVLKEIDLLVNTTPVGMHAGDPLLVAEESLHNGLAVYDLVYNRETELFTAARAKGISSATGLSMLLYQGCISQEQWTHHSAPAQIMRAVLNERFSI